jgi:beta-ureidopropionase
LKDQGAKIVFWPSAYPAGKQLPALALINEYYIVSSTNSGSAHIYDITGESLAASGKYQHWARASLQLDKRLFEVDYNASKAQEIQRRYGPRVEVTWYHDSDWFTLASLDADLTLQEVMTEYNLVPLDEYLARSAKVINQARAEAEHKVQAAK